MDKKEIIFFTTTMIVCVIVGIFICFIFKYFGISLSIALLINLVIGFIIGFIGRILYNKYK